MKEESERESGNFGLEGEQERALEPSWLSEGYNDCHIAEH